MDEAKTAFTKNDPLLSCLMILIKFYNRHYSPESLIAGLPLNNNQLTPSLFIRAAERAGFIAKIIERPLEKISDLVLPVVLILKDNECCILKSWCDEEKNNAEIILPEVGISGATQKSIAALNNIYSGFAILMHPVPKVALTDDYKTKEQDWFWGTLWNYRHSYFEVLLAAFFINVFALVSPLFVMNVYDRVVPNNALLTLWTLTIGVSVIYIVDLLLRFLRAYLIDVVGKRADVLMASSLFQQALTIELKHKPQSVGGFVNNLREFETIRDFFTSATLTTLVDLPFLLLYLLLIGYIGGYLVLIPVITIATTIVIAWIIEKPLSRASQQTMQSSAQKHSIMVESFTGIETIKSIGAEGLLQNKWEQAVGLNAGFGLTSRFLSNLIGNLTYFIQQMMTIFIIVMGVYLIGAKSLTLGGLIACSILAGRLMAPLAQLMSLLTRYQQARVAFKGLNQFMSIPTEYSDAKRFLHIEKVKGEIEFKQVSFQYPGQDQTKALDNISFKIKAGEHIALLGRIGSGKSTLLRLLLGLYRPTSGAIYIDGIDITQLDPASLRHRIGYVPQDVLLFAGSVRENIIMGQPDADDATVLAAAKLSGVDNFISRHPLGYGLTIRERGEGLSGGQRQTIAIARAILSNPDLIIFDEPTSSMDENLEQEWIVKMKSYLVDKTLILSTHKASVISLADRIMILDNGKLVVDGPRDEVLKRLIQPQRQS